MKTFRSSDGLTLAYEDEGTGLPVLCLAGLTRNHRDFAPVVAAFADRYRIIRLDSRGRGESDHDPDFMNYSVPVEARDALELLDHLGLERAVVIGTSRGGLLAMTIAAAAPARLAGVVLVDIGPEIAPGIAEVVARVGLTPRQADLDATARAAAETYADRFPGVPLATWRRWIGDGFAETPDGMVLRYDARLRDALARQAEEGPVPDLWPVFDGFAGLPLALIHGANSDILAPETVEKMRARRPDMLIAEIPDRGHVPFLDEGPSVETIAALLAQAEARTET